MPIIEILPGIGWARCCARYAQADHGTCRASPCEPEAASIQRPETTSWTPVASECGTARELWGATTSLWRGCPPYSKQGHGFAADSPSKPLNPSNNAETHGR